jgi:hypothetical protein
LVVPSPTAATKNTRLALGAFRAPTSFTHVGKLCDRVANDGFATTDELRTAMQAMPASSTDGFK